MKPFNSSFYRTAALRRADADIGKLEPSIFAVCVTGMPTRY
jgi:hypothetical protein